MNYKIVGFTSLFVVFFSCGCILNILAQTNCDTSLTKLSAGPLGYKDRGDRCEGIYIKEVGSTTLQVVSLTEYFGQYNLKSGKPLTITWNNPPGNNYVSLRAQGLRRKLYYRMDTYQPAKKMFYSWPTNFLASLNIAKSEIGVAGISQYSVGGLQRNIYIPLRISQEKENIQTGIYNLILLPGIELSEVFISIAPLAADGHLGKFIMDGKKLGYGYYPAERGIAIPVSGLKESGIYYLEIGAQLKNGGTSTKEIWFYHSKTN
ncbi:MAG: hypothetical protein ABIO55_14835 [Ginsengibacter sp.]